MNPYELSNFQAINSFDLITNFNNGKTIRECCISVFDDTIGKPGDRMVELKSIVHVENTLIFEFGVNEKIIITEPEYIVINSKIIGIGSFKMIKWHFKELELLYTKENDQVVGKVISGEHYFRIKKGAVAFMLYTW